MENLIVNNENGESYIIKEFMDIFKLIKQGETLIIAANDIYFNEYIALKNSLAYNDLIFDNYINLNSIIIILTTLDQSKLFKLNNKFLDMVNSTDITVSINDLNMIISNETYYYIEIIISKVDTESDYLDDEYIFEEEVLGFQNAINYLTLYKNVIHNLINYNLVNSSICFYLKSEMVGKISGKGKLNLFQYGNKINTIGLNREFRISKKIEKELMKDYISIVEKNILKLNKKINNDDALVAKIFNKKIYNSSNMYSKLRDLIIKLNYYELEIDQDQIIINPDNIFKILE